MLLKRSLFSEDQTVLLQLTNISTQQAKVSRIEKEQKLVDANRQLIALYEQKIKDRIDRIWNV